MMYGYDEFDDEQNHGYSDDLYNDGEELDFSHKDSDDILELGELPEITAVEITSDDNYIITVMRAELKKLECSRKKFKVLYDGKTYNCSPLSELKSGKFVFDICGKLKAIPITDIMF